MTIYNNNDTAMETRDEGNDEPGSDNEEEEDKGNRRRVGLLCALVAVQQLRRLSQRSPRHKGNVIIRQRRTVSSVFYELGGMSRRYFRMSEKSFWKLHELLRCQIGRELEQRVDSVHRKRRESPRKTAPNGLICTSIRLAAAIRYFAGGSPLDIALVFGISHKDVMKSVWSVVDSINKTSELAIVYPECHNNQSKIAKGFEYKSTARFGNCAGAIDGMLVWIQRPSCADIKKMPVGPRKFYCGRKKKFGMNLQAVCDAERRFLDISCMFPGAMSDYLSFKTSSLFHKLETGTFLKPGLALFGDNAYVSNSYMVTPFKAVSSGPKDAYNFYQSQTRIAIECAFGMLVQRWGMLRKAMPPNVSIAKTSAIVAALCKLHNYCIDEKMPEMSAQDELNIDIEGGFSLAQQQTTNSQATGEIPRPSALLDGNELPRDDFDRAAMAREERMAERNTTGPLPRDTLLRIVEENNLQRIVPVDWQ